MYTFYDLKYFKILHHCGLVDRLIGERIEGYNDNLQDG